MFLFFKKKPSKDSKLYPSFISRLFASLLDSTIAALILIPLTSIISHLIYGDTSPIKELGLIIQNATSSSADFYNDPSYIEFMQIKGYSSIFLEQGLQIGLMGIIIFTFWLKTHSTPGKMLLSIKIVDAKTLGEPTSIQLIIRLLAYITIIPGLFFILFNRRKRAWHDIISDTVVVYTKHLQQTIQGTPINV